MGLIIVESGWNSCGKCSELQLHWVIYRIPSRFRPFGIRICNRECGVHALPLAFCESRARIWGEWRSGLLVVFRRLKWDKACFLVCGGGNAVKNLLINMRGSSPRWNGHFFSYPPAQRLTPQFLTPCCPHKVTQMEVRRWQAKKARRYITSRKASSYLHHKPIEPIFS